MNRTIINKTNMKKAHVPNMALGSLGCMAVSTIMLFNAFAMKLYFIVTTSLLLGWLMAATGIGLGATALLRTYSNRL